MNTQVRKQLYTLLNEQITQIDENVETESAGLFARMFGEKKIPALVKLVNEIGSESFIETLRERKLINYLALSLVFMDKKYPTGEVIEFQFLNEQLKALHIDEKDFVKVAKDVCLRYQKFR